MRRVRLLCIPLAAAVVVTGACSNSGDTKRGAPAEKVGEAREPWAPEGPVRT